MPKPTAKDLAKHKDMLAKLDGQLVDGKLPQKAQLSLLRSTIRRVWMRHPVKLAALYRNRHPDNRSSTRSKWLYTCALCSPTTPKFVQAQVEVDHITGENTLTKEDELMGFYRAILDVSVDELQVVCKDCHRVKTYSERYGVSMDEAKVQLAVVAWVRKHKATAQKRELLKYGAQPDDISNEKARREWLAQHLREGNTIE